jgi:hypothetical protein
MGKAYNAAAALLGDGFRPCGRPFMAHVTGTASVLVQHGFSLRVIQAALLHAAYSHVRLGPQPISELNGLREVLRATFGYRIEATISRYARFQADPEQWCAHRPVSQLTIDDAETMAIAIANEIDEHVAGEFAFTAKHPLGSGWYAYAQQCVDALAAPALGQALAHAARTQLPDGFDLRRPQSTSYRYIDGKQAPMVHCHLARWNFEDEITLPHQIAG